MRNEKLVPMTLPDPRERQPFLPQPNGDNKLTAAMVPYYTGWVFITIEIKKNISLHTHNFIWIQKDAFVY